MQKKNWFVRFLIIVLIVFIALIIGVSFFYSKNRLIITAPIICLISILVVLALAEIFDNFSIGNVMSLQKENKRVGSELKTAQQENRELRLQLTNIFTNMNSNNNMTILGQFPGLMDQILRVEKAQDDEVEKKKQEEAAQDSRNNEGNTKQEKLDFATRRRMSLKIEELALSKYCDKYDIKCTDVFKEMKFSEGFIDYDPIMERNVIFDAYYRAPWQEEIFIEICHHYISPSMFDKFYYLLSKIYHYRAAKKLQAKLVVIVPRVSESKLSELSYNTRGISKERFLECFSPAIRNNLLEFIEIQISDEEIEKIKNQEINS